MQPHAVLMAATKFHSDFSPDLHHHLTESLVVDLQPSVTIQPGALATTSRRVPMHWQSAVRYEDELFMKDQCCLAIAGGRADVQLEAAGGGAGAAPAAPFAITLGFSPRNLGMWKRRACHVPASCRPAAEKLFSGGCTAATCSVAGGATLASDGTIGLINHNQRGVVTSAFSHARAPLLDGFTTSFDFTIRRHCTRWWDECKPLSGGFAFVLHASGDGPGGPPPAGKACQVTAVVVQKFEYNPAVSGLEMSNDTTISCAGYSGLGPHSVGVLFSLPSGHVGNRYWKVDGPVVSELSDWARGSLSLFVNGEVRNTTSYLGAARGVAQHGGATALDAGTHHVEIQYSPALRMLYVHLDGNSAPSLWAELDPADMGVRPSQPMGAGFTATPPASGESISIEVDHWQMAATRTDARASTLLEAGEVVGAAGQRSVVHVTCADSCGWPRLAGGQGWTISINGARVEETLDLGDGTHRVAFTAPSAGTYQVVGDLHEHGKTWARALHAEVEVVDAPSG